MKIQQIAVIFVQLNFTAGMETENVTTNLYRDSNTYLGSRPHTEPDILPPGPDSPGDHFFHVEMVF